MMLIVPEPTLEVRIKIAWRKSTVLPWPSDNTTHKTPRDYLDTLGIQSYAVVPLKGTRVFDFKSGVWKNPDAAMDY